MAFFDDHIDIGQLFEIRPLRGSLLPHHSVNLSLSSGTYILAWKSTNDLRRLLLPFLDIRIRHQGQDNGQDQ